MAQMSTSKVSVTVTNARTCEVCYEDLNNSTHKLVNCDKCEYKCCKQCVRSYFKDIFVKNYLVELQKKFTRSEIEDIFYNAGNLIAPRNNCNCNRGSMFGCGTSGNCYGACNTNTITNSGCGFLWAWECNAKCKLFEI